MTTAMTVKTRDRLFGDRPAHEHRDPVSGERWRCNSPYCEVMEQLHPDNGGLEPIVIGREPWRGR